MKQFATLCALALALSLLSGCAVTSPKDEEFQKEFQEDWEESMEDMKADLKAAWDHRDKDGAEKDHYWKILDASGQETGTVTDEEQVKALDDLLSDDDGSSWAFRHAEAPGDPACSYVYCQQETLKAGQDPEDREYEELVRFTVSAEEDVVTIVILEELPSLPNVDLGDFLTFSFDVPEETAKALRDPAAL